MITNRASTSQRLRVLPDRWVLGHRPGAFVPTEDDDWIGLVRAPEGLSLITRAPEPSEDAGDTWVAFYGGDTPHGLDVPGLLCALLAPLRDAEISVYVASTHHADLVLIPADSQEAATRAFVAAVHEVVA